MTSSDSTNGRVTRPPEGLGRDGSTEAGTPSSPSPRPKWRGVWKKTRRFVLGLGGFATVAILLSGHLADLRKEDRELRATREREEAKRAAQVELATRCSGHVNGIVKSALSVTYFRYDEKKPLEFFANASDRLDELNTLISLFLDAEPLAPAVLVAEIANIRAAVFKAAATPRNAIAGVKNGDVREDQIVTYFPHFARDFADMTRTIAHRLFTAIQRSFPSDVLCESLGAETFGQEWESYLAKTEEVFAAHTAKVDARATGDHDAADDAAQRIRDRVGIILDPRQSMETQGAR